MIVRQSLAIRSAFLPQQHRDASVTVARVANAAGKWRADAAKYLDALASYPPALPEQGSARLGEALVAWRKQFAESRNYVGVERLELEKELAATHAAFQQARTITEDLSAGGLEFSEWAHDLFVPPVSGTAFSDLVSVAKTHGDALNANLDHPDLFRTAPAQRQREQRAAWEKALRSAIPSTDFTTVQAALEKGQWTMAAQTARKLMPASGIASDEETALGGERGTGAPPAANLLTPAPIARCIPFHTSPVVGMSNSAGSLYAAPELAGTLVERVVLARAEGRAAFYQTAILSGIFVALAYGFYSGQWIGTFREMLGVFAWAFGLDLTADALAPLLKKVGSPPSAS